jgi:hypothetical protein
VWPDCHDWYGNLANIPAGEVYMCMWPEYHDDYGDLANVCITSYSALGMPKELPAAATLPVRGVNRDRALGQSSASRASAYSRKAAARPLRLFPVILITGNSDVNEIKDLQKKDVGFWGSGPFLVVF